jgi:hypothetical protein
MHIIVDLSLQKFSDFFASSDALGFLLPKRMLATKVQIVAKEQELETKETKDYQKD